MIRPITLVCFLLACASGLYLYQEKHRVQMIDRQIEKTVHATDAIREQTRVLHAEWTLLNDPQRLQALADQFLSLKTVAPGQFTSLAQLDSRLPPVRPPEPPQQEAPPPAAVPTLPPVAQQAPPSEPPAETPAPAAKPVIAADKPVIAAEKPVVAAAAPPPVEHKPAPVVKPQVAAVAAVAPAPTPRPEPKPPERHAIVAQAARPSPPRALAAAPSQPAASFAGGSALGMAHGTFVPPPQPMPVNASQWVSPGGGGGG